MSKIFNRDKVFRYAEFGFYRADTARNVCERFPKASLYLFDFNHNVDDARIKLRQFNDRIEYFGNTQKYNDSYNWNLLKLIARLQGEPLFDYCFLDGAHTFAVDALTFLLCDRLLRIGGYLDFDDYGWTLRGSSLDPKEVPSVADQYTDEQIDAKQVALIVDNLVRPDVRYREVVPNKVFQKVG